MEDFQHKSRLVTKDTQPSQQLKSIYQCCVKRDTKYAMMIVSHDSQKVATVDINACI